MNKQQQSSTLVMTLAIIAATMLVSTVIVETLDLFEEAEARDDRNKGKQGESSSDGKRNGHKGGDRPDH